MATANLDSSRTSTAAGLKVKQEFCPAGVLDPFTTAEWETRSAAIKDESGGILFEQDNCEIPTTWSQLATNVIVSKYFYGEIGTPEREYSVRQLVRRNLIVAVPIERRHDRRPWPPTGPASTARRRAFF